LKVVNSAGINAQRVRHGSTAPCTNKKYCKSVLKKSYIVVLAWLFKSSFIW